MLKDVEFIKKCAIIISVKKMLRYLYVLTCLATNTSDKRVRKRY